MTNAFRRIASTLAALTVIGGAGVGIAGAATPETTGSVPTAVAIGDRDWFDPVCEWRDGFDWHYYHYCDDNYWHGNHFNDWQWFDRRHQGYDYDRHH